MKGAGTNQLRFSVNSLNERRGVGHAANGALRRGIRHFEMGSRLEPFGFAGVLVEPNKKLFVRAVAGEDQKVPMQNQGTRRTLKSIVFELGIFPNDLAGYVQTRRPARAEVNESVRTIQYGRG